MYSNPTWVLCSCLSPCKQQQVSRHPINTSLLTTTEKQANRSMREREAHGLQKAMPHSQSSANLSAWCLPRIFLCFLTTDGFLTTGSILVFPWHFSPTSHFICSGRGKKKKVWRWLGVLKWVLLHFSIFIRTRSQNQLVMPIKISEKDTFALGMHGVAFFKGTRENTWNRELLTHLLSCSSENNCWANRTTYFSCDRHWWSGAIFTFGGCSAMSFHPLQKVKCMFHAIWSPLHYS